MPINDPIAWYRLDEGTGTSAKDSAGSNDGTVNGGAAWESAAQIGAGLILDGTNDFVDCGTGIPALANGTVAAWVKLSANGSYPMLFTRENGTGLNWEFTAGQDVLRKPYYGFDGGILLQSPTALTVGVWAHLCLTIHATAGAVLYIDALPSVTDGALTSFRSGNGIARIGKRSDGFFLPGTVDDLRIYDRALSQAEVTELFEWRGDPAVLLGSGGHRKQQPQRRWYSYVEQWLDELEEEEERKAALLKKARAAAAAAARVEKFRVEQQARTAERIRQEALEQARRKAAAAEERRLVQEARAVNETKRVETAAQVQAALARVEARKQQAAELAEEEELRRLRQIARSPHRRFSQRFEAAVKALKRQGWRAKT